MAREVYQESLDDLRADVRAMGDLVLDRLDLGVSALEDDHDALARRVIDGDEAVNDRYLALESRCIDLFALQQPVASDLRFVAASFKIITDLERIGDLAVNFGEYALASDRDRTPEIDVYDIGTDARGLVSDALDAYESGDADACREIAARDDRIDALCERASEAVVRDLIEREVDAGDAWAVESIVDEVSCILLTIRDAERVGDHGVNIAARTLYMTTNDSELIY